MMNTTTAIPTAADLYTDPFPGRKGDERVQVPCYRCGADAAAFAHYVALNGGRCFACDGARFTTSLVSSLRATARRHAREEAARLAQVAADLVVRETAKAEHPAEYAWIEAHEATSSFARSLWERLEHFGARDLSEAQWASVSRIIAQDAERAAKRAEAAPLVEGRREVVGVILSEKSVETAYGTAWKMLVEEEGGARVYGSIPSSILSETAKGARVAFTATVERSRDDAAFGFYSRPTKARVL